MIGMFVYPLYIRDVLCPSHMSITGVRTIYHLLVIVYSELNRPAYISQIKTIANIIKWYINNAYKDVISKLKKDLKKIKTI